MLFKFEVTGLQVADTVQMIDVIEIKLIRQSVLIVYQTVLQAAASAALFMQ